MAKVRSPLSSIQPVKSQRPILSVDLIGRLICNGNQSSRAPSFICMPLLQSVYQGSFASLLLLGVTLRCEAQLPGDVVTFHNDNARTGQNLYERVLVPTGINATSFGKLYTVPVDGKVDAQPLFLKDFFIPGKGKHDIVYAATEHDTVYAFDAQSGAILWRTSLLSNGETTSDALSCGQVSPEIGITATPVIDRRMGPLGTIFLVAMSKDANGSYHQRLHALNLASGHEQAGSPVEIQATYPGTGDESSNGVITFNPKQHEDRAGLLLSNGIVYTSWSSHCDHRPYTGWVIGYNAQTLQQTSVTSLSPHGSEASIWSSGGGPAADSQGNIFISVANGTFDTQLDSQGFPIARDFGNAFVKLTPLRAPVARALPVTDYWTMFNTVTESDMDQDLGSGSITLLPDIIDANGKVHQLGVGAGKDANLYVVDLNNLGKFNASSNANIYQEIPKALEGKEYATAAYFNNTVYIGAVGDVMRAFPLNGLYLATSPSSVTQSPFTFPGTTPSISANLSESGIVWALDNAQSGAPGILHAYDARNLGRELYNSNEAPGGRDHFGPGNKFIVPTVAGGKVFLGTTNSVAVFGPLPGSAAAQ